MANIKSAKKRIKTAIRNTERNKAVNTEIKTLRKKTEIALAAKSDQAQTLLKRFISRVDSAVSKGVYHKNKAARLKSRVIAKANKK
jgi:small subunit ribosomal protein S20